MRVLVTGATGGLGKYLLEHLHAQQALEVFSSSRTTTVANPLHFVCDLAQPGALSNVLEQVRPERVYHLAADFSDDFARALAVNFASSVELLNWAEAQTARARVLLVGSAAEYGVVNPAENPISELRPLAPVSAYGVSKACQSQLVAWYASRDVDVRCARLFNLRGAGLSQRMFVGRIAAQIQEIKSGSRTAITCGPLSAARDFISIPEALAQLSVVMERGLAGQIYHVASGNATTMHDLLIEELNLNGLSTTPIEQSAGFSNRAGYDVPIIYANIAKTSRLMRHN